MMAGVQDAVVREIYVVRARVLSSLSPNWQP